MAKRNRTETFRTRLIEAMARKDATRSGLAREIGVDRSTIGQILKGDLPRMPSAQLAADAANVLGVSTDWLLGLSDNPELPGDIVASAMGLSPAERSSANDQLLEWHHQAIGYKVRHVPATLPDFFKSDTFLRWEFPYAYGELIDQSIQAMETHFQWLESGDSDYEIALPIHELKACASSTGYYSELDTKLAKEQLYRVSVNAVSNFPKSAG